MSPVGPVPPAGQEVYAEIDFLEPWGRDDMSVGVAGHLLPSWPEAELWVIEQTGLHRDWLVTSVQITAEGEGA